MMNDDPILCVLTYRHGGKAWTYVGSGYDGIIWGDSSPKPSETELLSQVEDVIAELSAMKASKESHRKNALQKLADLGLSEAEVAALLGA